MALSEVKLKQGIAYSLEVSKIKGPLKSFNSSEGMKDKYILEFVGGYAAEYCPLMGTFDHENIEEGKICNFKIIFQKTQSDEILPFRKISEDNSTAVEMLKQNHLKEQGKFLGGPVINANGHPAVTALRAAVDIFTSEVAAGKKRDEGEGIAEIFEHADQILDWLNKNLNEN